MRIEATETMRMKGTEPVLGRGLRVRGRVTGDGDLRVEAQVQGDVSVSGSLYLDADAKVSGVLKAQSIVVAGSLEGDAIATGGSVTVTASGCIDGDITANELNLEEGGQLRGRVNADFELPDGLE
jgi:cytoskeletal protein CcmA (bactofilin family)